MVNDVKHYLAGVLAGIPVVWGVIVVDKALGASDRLLGWFNLLPGVTSVSGAVNRGLDSAEGGLRRVVNR